MKGGRPSIETELRAKVTEFLAHAVTLAPTQQPISLRAVATAVGHDRRVLKKYGLDRDIDLAGQQQRRQHRSTAGKLKCSLDQSLVALSEELALRTQQYENVVALLALTEANARRLGIDPEELHRPLTVPDRSVSATYKSKQRR
jgi:hypothetical protein